jgi:hypothetical protein
MKICPVAAELLHAEGWTDRRTDMMKLIVTFCNFANEPKNADPFHQLEKIFYLETFLHTRNRA